MPTKSLTVSGDIRYFDQQTDSGNTVSRGICPTCGSLVVNTNSGYRDSRYIHAATLDDSSIFRPTVVVYSASVQTWDYMDPALD